MAHNLLSGSYYFRPKYLFLMSPIRLFFSFLILISQSYDLNLLKIQIDGLCNISELTIAHS